MLVIRLWQRSAGSERPSDRIRSTGASSPGHPHGTEVTITCDVRPGVARKLRASQWIAGSAGSFAGVFTGALLAKGAAIALSAAVLAPAVGVGLTAVGVSLAADRRMYAATLAQAQREI